MTNDNAAVAGMMSNLIYQTIIEERATSNMHPPPKHFSVSILSLDNSGFSIGASIGIPYPKKM